ncbi:MAG: DUF1573 domain-containing protein [Phycisphaerales bacterium]
MRSMTRLIALALASLVCHTTPAQTVKTPPIRVDNDAIEIGRHAPGDSAIVDFKVINTSDAPLKLTRVQGNCPCIGVVVRDPVVPANGSAMITLAIDTPKKMGRLTRELYIFAEGFNAPLRLPVYGDLEYGVIVNKGGVPELLQRQGVITLTSVDARAFTVTSANGETPVSAIEGRDPAQPARSHAIRFDLGDAPATDLPRFFTIETDHPDARSIPVRVSIGNLWREWRDARPLRIVSERETLFPVAAGSKQKVLVELAGVEPGPADSISVVSSNPDISVRVLALRKPPQGGGGAACDLEIAVSPDATGPFHALVTFSTGENEAGLDIYGVAEPRNRKIRAR